VKSPPAVSRFADAAAAERRYVGGRRRLRMSKSIPLLCLLAGQVNACAATPVQPTPNAATTTSASQRRASASDNRPEPQIRSYSPATRSFSVRSGKLVCDAPSISNWEQSANDYQRELRAAIEALRSDFKACYLAELRNNSKVSGTSCVLFGADVGGKIDRTEISSSTLPVTLLDCILERAAEAHVPRTGSGDLKVMLPLTFQQ
jgi:hypothetical protein